MKSKLNNPALLETQKLNKKFGGNHAVQNVSLKLYEKKVNAIVGPNGSGKSTFFNLVSKVYAPTSGKIYLRGEDITALRDYMLASPKNKNSISRTFQETPLFPYLTVRQHLLLASRKNDQSFFSAFKKPAEEKDEDLEKYLSAIGLNISLNFLASSLSYGQKKLLTFAISTIKPHKVLLIDEPVSGVNPALRITMANLILKLKKKGETIVLIEHDMKFVFSVADHVAVMDSGRLIFQGTPQEVRKNKDVLNAYMGS